MKTMILAAVAAFSLGAGAAYAQGYSGAQPPVYGAKAFPNQSYQSGTVFSGIFGHSSNQPAADKTAERAATPAKGS
jgi:hypothetical protein